MSKKKVHSVSQLAAIKQWLPVLSLLVLVVAVIGLADASFITYEEARGIIPPCTGSFKCATVLQSPWSKIGSIPLSVFGMIFYSTVLGLGIAHYLDVKPWKVGPARFRVQDLLMVVTSIGALFSAYLVLIMAVILQAWCLYCLISAVTSSTLFVLSGLIAKLRWNVSYPSVSGFRVELTKLVYQSFLKKIFFLVDPETIHVRMIETGEWLGSMGVFRWLMNVWFSHFNSLSGKTLDGIHFPGVVGLGAGFDYNAQLTGVGAAVGFGFLTVGTITWQPSEGNQQPRLGRFPNSKALLVNKGFRNPGARAVEQKLLGKKFEVPVGISIGSTNQQFRGIDEQMQDIISSFKFWEASQVAHSYYELNISCPNTQGGEPFTTAMKLKKLLNLLDVLRIRKPVYIKMPIDLSDEVNLELLKEASHHQWVKGVVFGNLTKDKSNPAVEPADREVWLRSKGNLSGKPTWHRSNNCIALTHQHFKNRFTIIGLGGIFTPEDALHKLALGADLVQLITGMIYEGPQLVGAINERLARPASTKSQLR